MTERAPKNPYFEVSVARIKKITEHVRDSTKDALVYRMWEMLEQARGIEVTPVMAWQAAIITERSRHLSQKDITDIAETHGYSEATVILLAQAIADKIMTR